MDRKQLLNDSEEALRIAFDSQQSGLWTSIPAIVKSVNFIKMTIEAQPTIQGSVEDENGKITMVNLPLLVDVPIIFQSAGGFTITLPIAVNDECLIMFASRCIDAWWQSGGINVPMESRMHDLSDGFAILGPKSLPHVIGSISSTGLQIRNNAGTTYIELSSDGKIKVVSTAEVDINAPTIKLTGVAEIDITAPIIKLDGAVTSTGLLTAAAGLGVTGNITPSSGPINISGALTSSGAINAASVAATGNVTAGAISLNSHTHTSGTPGNPTSGPL